MELIINDLLPVRGFKCMAMWPFVFVRTEAIPRFRHTDKNHEGTHLGQQAEMLVVPFYVWYVVEWLVRLVQYRNARQAYRNISFEREAYANERDDTYLSHRKHYAWVKYLWLTKK